MSQNITSNEDYQKNWSHVSETVNMLYLAVCQIETTMTDANDSVDTLTKSFTHLANHTRDVGHHVENVVDKDDFKDVKHEIAETTHEIQDNISQAIQAFQFYDRVCQRIDHVARSLEKVSELLSDREVVGQRPHWKKVQDQIKSSYTMEAERIMFEFIMRGGSVKEALEIYRHHFSTEPEDSDDSDEIELF